MKRAVINPIGVIHSFGKLFPVERSYNDKIMDLKQEDLRS